MSYVLQATQTSQEERPLGRAPVPFPPKGFLSKEQATVGKKGMLPPTRKSWCRHWSMGALHPSKAEGLGRQGEVAPASDGDDQTTSAGACAHKELRVPPTAPFHRK